MRIALINETSAADRNADVLAALEGRGHEIINAGMTQTGAQPELTYVHTGLLSALVLNLGRADLVVGGCGTGQGFLNSAMQYPGVFCGLIQTPLDAWLFGQINGGNCISLALNFGYGWAGDVNLKFGSSDFCILLGAEEQIDMGEERAAMRRRSGRHTDLWKWDRTDGLTGGSGDRIYRSAPSVRFGPAHFQRSMMPSSPSPKAASLLRLARQGCAAFG